MATKKERAKEEIDSFIKRINVNCPNCKGKTGKKCKVCDGTGKTKIRPLK